MIVVIGPGALGLLVTALIREAALEEVVLIDRDAARAAKLDEDGFAIEGPDARPARRVRLEVSSDPAPIARADLVVVCVKAHDDAAVARTIASAGGDATILTLGNGLGRAEALARELAPARVLGGSTTEGATRLAPDRVRHAGRGITRVAPLVPEGRARAEAAAHRLRNALDVRIEDDARRLSFEKVLVNASINALAGLLDVPNGKLLESQAAMAFADGVALETAAVARALRIPGDWTPDTVREAWRQVARATALNLCSTVQDLRARRTTEVRAINGALVQAASEAGLQAPLCEALTRLIQAREELPR